MYVSIRNFVVYKKITNGNKYSRIDVILELEFTFEAANGSNCLTSYVLQG